MLTDRPFGAWVVFLAAFMRVYEEFTYQQRLDSLLDQYDAMISAEATDAALQEMTGGQVTPAPKRSRQHGVRRG